MQAVQEAYEQQDWARLRALYHDDALLSTVAAQHEILPPDELIAVFRRLATDSVYEVDGATTEILDDSAALVVGRIRYPLSGGGFGDGNRSWVLTMKDELLYRTCAYATPARAREAYAEHGVTLGIVPDPSP